MNRKLSNGLLERSAADDWLRLVGKEGSVEFSEEVLERQQKSRAYADIFQDYARLDDHLETLLQDESLTAQLESEFAEKVAASPKSRASRSLLATFAVAASLLVAVSLTMWLSPSERGADSRADRYVTRTGELRTLTLADGSSVVMNTGTELLVEMTDDLRSVRLQRGEAFFSIERDVNRPFVVSLDGRQLTVLGTEFNVRKTLGGFQLAVTEGLVAYHLENQPLGSYRKLPAEIESDLININDDGQWVFGKGLLANFDTAQGVGVVSQPRNIERLTDWRTGRIRFEDQTLFDVVLELNRYSGKKILINDKDLLPLKVNAIVHVSDVNMALTILSKGLPIRIEHQFDQILIAKDQGD